jgi:hypothetical protein
MLEALLQAKPTTDSPHAKVSIFNHYALNTSNSEIPPAASHSQSPADLTVAAAAAKTMVRGSQHKFLDTSEKLVYNTSLPLSPPSRRSCRNAAYTLQGSGGENHQKESSG